MEFKFCYYAIGNVTKLKLRLVLDLLNISLLAYMIFKHTCSYIIMHNDIYFREFDYSVYIFIMLVEYVR